MSGFNVERMRRYSGHARPPLVAETSYALEAGTTITKVVSAPGTRTFQLRQPVTARAAGVYLARLYADGTAELVRAP